MTTIIRAFGYTRVAVGAIAWLAPGFAARLFGTGKGPGEQPVVTQLFGARDLALGALTATSSGEELRRVLRTGVALDVADTAASLWQIRAGTLRGHGILGVTAGAAAFAALGVVALSSSADGRDPAAGAGPAPGTA